MRRCCYILFAALAVAGAACKPAPPRTFNMQKALTAQGVSIRKLTLNPAMLTPFLDSNHAEEAALKEFLRSVKEVNVFFFPDMEVLNGVAARAQAAGYTQRMELRQDSVRRMWVYALSSKKCITNLALLLQESGEVFYGVEMSGQVDSRTLAALSRLSPAFIDRYIRRFNVKF